MADLPGRACVVTTSGPVVTTSSSCASDSVPSSDPSVSDNPVSATEWKPGDQLSICVNQSGEEQQQVKDLIHEFSDVFACGEDRLGRCLHATHKVNIGDRPPYRVSPSQGKEIVSQFENLIKAAVVRESRSP